MSSQPTRWSGPSGICQIVSPSLVEHESAQQHQGDPATKYCRLVEMEEERLAEKCGEESECQQQFYQFISSTSVSIDATLSSVNGVLWEPGGCSALNSAIPDMRPASSIRNQCTCTDITNEIDQESPLLLQATSSTHASTEAACPSLPRRKCNYPPSSPSSDICIQSVSFSTAIGNAWQSLSITRRAGLICKQAQLRGGRDS